MVRQDEGLFFCIGLSVVCLQKMCWQVLVCDVMATGTIPGRGGPPGWHVHAEARLLDPLVHGLSSSTGSEIFPDHRSMTLCISKIVTGGYPGVQRADENCMLDVVSQTSE
jgi:hypothetical protein